MPEIEYLSGADDGHVSGLVADRSRDIRDGKEYDKYFPHSDGLTGILKRNGSVKDTVKFMHQIIQTTLSDTSKIADLLRDNTLEETLNKIWEFTYNHVQYKLDAPGKEQLRRPARTWAERATGADCDCMSIFISSILTNLHIAHYLRIADYGNGWQHVYVVVPKKGVSTPLGAEGGNYYTLDCVLDRFDYEKRPVLKKVDYNMTKGSLNGIPIEYLSGPEAQMYAELNGIVGENSEFNRLLDSISDDDNALGEVEVTPEQYLAAIYKHLVDTRNFIAKHPDSVIAQGGAQNQLDMFDYAISKWNTPEREYALDKLEADEIRMNAEKQRLGIPVSEDEVGPLGMTLDGFFSKVWGGVKKAVKAVGKGVSTAAKAVAKGATSAVKAVGTAAKAAGKVILKYNPLMIAARGGVLLAMRMNFKGLAKKANANKADYEKTKKIFTSSPLFGKESNLKSAIEKGAKAKHLAGFGDTTTMDWISTGIVGTRAVTNGIDGTRGVTNRHGHVNGLGEPITIASIASSIPFLAKIIAAVTGKSMSEGEIINDIASEAQDAIRQGDITSADTDPSALTKEGENSQDPAQGSEAEEIPQEGFFAKSWKFVKNNPVVAIGGVAVVGGLLFLAFRPKKKAAPSAALGAVKIYRKGRVVHPRRYLPRHSKIKAITLKG